MSGRRLSIFSFDTFRLKEDRPPGFVKAILLTLVLIILSEIVAHWIVFRGGQYAKYWDMEPGIKLEAYRQRVKESPFEVVIVGDSTGLVDIDPVEFEKFLPDDVDAYNLACGGSYPLAFRCTNYPLLKEPYASPKLVIASFSPSGFLDHFANQNFEQEIIDSLYCRCIDASIFNLRCLQLTMVLPTLYNIKNKDQINADTERVLKQRGFRPMSISRKTPRILDSGNNPGIEQSAKSIKINSDRLHVVTELAELANSRQFHLLFIIPPQIDSIAGAALRVELEKLKTSFGFTVVDYSNPPFLSKRHFYDNVHLNTEGAMIYSKEIGKLIVPLLTGSVSYQTASRRTK